MYINKISLHNIRCFADITIDLDANSGWHVFLGKNGAGKSTLMRAIALALFNALDIKSVYSLQNWNNWLRNKKEDGKISLDVNSKSERTIFFKIPSHGGIVDIRTESKPINLFSAGYGSFRRLAGGDSSFENHWNNFQNVAAHLSLFSNSIALDKAIDWLGKLELNALARTRKSNVVVRTCLKIEC